MPVEQTPGGGLLVTGNSISLYRLIVLEHAIELEIKGMSNSRGSVTQMVKREFGFRGSRRRVLRQLHAFRLEQFPQEDKTDEQSN